MRVFVPVEDASVDAMTGVLVPYRCGVPCAHGLRGEFVLDEDGAWHFAPISDGSASRRPAPGRASSPDRR